MTMRNENHMTTHLLWLDYETTGLNPAEDHILEVGWAISPLRVEFLNPLIDSRVITPKPDITRLLQQSPEAYAMHKDSGLLIDLYSEGTVMLEDAEDAIIASLPSEGTAVLAGASVHFDRGFMARYMPRLDGRLSHRHVDTTSTKYLLEGVGLTIEVAPNPKPHRAANDVEWCMAYHNAVQSTLRAAINLAGAVLKETRNA